MKKNIKDVALLQLNKECKTKEKTKDLNYENLKPRGYLGQLYPKQAKAIFQARCKTLDIKEHRQYRYKDMVCRLCGKEDETLSHIVNCGSEHKVNVQIIHDVGEDTSYETTLKLITISTRIVNFLEDVK